MKKKSILICVTFFFIHANAQVKIQDSLVLINIFNSSGGSNWLQKWNRTQPVSSWYGVTVSAGNVTHLILPANNLQGNLSSTNILKLSKLKVLDLSSNSLSGNIPPGLRSLTDLQQLNLSVNNFSGTVPANFFDSLSQLSHLNLSNNHLSGWIPRSIGSATSLTFIDLSHNEFNGKIPTEVGNLIHLTELRLTHNQLNGAIPDGLRNIPLSILVLSYNAIRHRIPPILSSSPSLQRIALDHNQLDGPIPIWLKRRSPYLDLSFNNLSGSLPDSIEKYGEKVYLNNNKLSGMIPKLSGLPAELNLSHNEFDFLFFRNCGTTLPGNGKLNLSHNYLDFSDLECLKTIGGIAELVIDSQATVPVENRYSVLFAGGRGTLANNTYTWYNGNTQVASVTGDPSYAYLTTGTYVAAITNSAVPGITLYSDSIRITNMGSLTSDSLALVELYGSFTSGLSWNFRRPVRTWQGVAVRNGRVEELQFYNVSGTIHPAVGKLSSLKGLILTGSAGETKLTGTLPKTIADLRDLQTLFLRGELSGTLPDSLGKYQQALNVINITNGLTGTIPGSLQYATSLYNLQLAGNQLTGPIPPFLKKLGLEVLDLSNNKFSGKIPDTLSSSNRMSVMSLNDNQLTGGIPEWLRFRTLGWGFNLSNNKLSGPLPNNFHEFGSFLQLQNNRFTGKVPLFASQCCIDISNNLLDAVDEQYCVDKPYLDNFNISGNKLNFDDFECLLPNPTLFGFVLTPQQRIPIINTNPVLKAAAGGTLTNNTYRWLRNTGPFVTKVGDSTLTITQPGVYACIVTNSAVPGVELRTHNANVSTVSARKIQPGEPLDADDALTIPGTLAVYPNPVSGDAIYIKGLQKAETVLLYNAGGQIVKQWHHISGNRALEINDITNGVYLIKIFQHNEQTILKFIKR